MDRGERLLPPRSGALISWPAWRQPFLRVLVIDDSAVMRGLLRVVLGRILVQDRQTSAVWGMPGAVARAGLATTATFCDGPMVLEEYDGILLRNVMLYFSIETRRQLLLDMYSMLHPDGFLILGSCEHPSTRSFPGGADSDLLLETSSITRIHPMKPRSAFCPVCEIFSKRGDNRGPNSAKYREEAVLRTSREGGPQSNPGCDRRERRSACPLPPRYGGLVPRGFRPTYSSTTAGLAGDRPWRKHTDPRSNRHWKDAHRLSLVP